MKRFAVLIAAITLIAAACTTDGDDAEATSQPDAAVPGLGTADSALGTVLVSSDGLSLYLFTNDSPDVTTCFDECLTNWPAFVAGGSIGDGVDAALVGSIDRGDGIMQATYNGWPLYYFAADANPGDTNGQGVGGVWFLLDPRGNAVEG